MMKMKTKLLDNNPSMDKPPEQQTPTVRQTLLATVILSTLAILLIGVGLGLKLAYGPSLYFRDDNYPWAVLGMVFMAIGLPLGVTATCLINVICRVRHHINYTEQRKKELESRVADMYIPEVPLIN